MINNECEQMASRKIEIGFGASCAFTRPWVGSVWIGSVKKKNDRNRGDGDIFGC